MAGELTEEWDSAVKGFYIYRELEIAYSLT